MYIDIYKTPIVDVIKNCPTFYNAELLLSYVCIHCPLRGACLQYYTGDDSENK